MRFRSRNILISILVLELVLISCAAGFDWFKKGDKKKAEEAAKDETSAKKGEVPGRDGAEPVSRRAQQQADELDDDDDDDQVEDDQDEAPQPPPRPASVASRMNRARGQKQSRQLAQPAKGAGKRADLDKIREAAAAQARFESREPKIERPGASESDNQVQGSGRRAARLQRREEEARRKAQQADEADEGDADESDDDDEQEDEFAASKLLDRLHNRKMRNHAATKFVSTKPREGLKGLKKPSLDYLKNSKPAKSTAFISGTIKKNKLITGSYWQKKLGTAYKATKKGIKEGAKVLSDMPKYMEKSLDSINAFLQLDSKGKILALIEEANGDANFVRKEFSQFTLSWSPIMEKALEYLGDEELDKIKWSDKDELDLKKDALNSLAFGYEFMRLMIIWRENLLLAHEAFKSWLESVKEKVEARDLEVNENVVIQARTTHTYMLLVSWMAIEEAAHEARTKLDYLMDVMDDRPKNYESEYFRNVVVLQELYEPSIEEFDRERDQVVNSISEAGVPLDNLSAVDEFFESFRGSLAAHELAGVDWQVPEQLEQFMSKIGPQLRSSSLVYTKAFLKEMRLKK